MSVFIDNKSIVIANSKNFTVINNTIRIIFIKITH